MFPAIALSHPLAWGVCEPGGAPQSKEAVDPIAALKGAAPPLIVGEAIAGAAIVVATPVYAVWRARREGWQ